MTRISRRYDPPTYSGICHTVHKTSGHLNFRTQKRIMEKLRQYWKTNLSLRNKDGKTHLCRELRRQRGPLAAGPSKRPLAISAKDGGWQWAYPFL